MPIVGFNFTKTTAENKNNEMKGNININTSFPLIKNIEKKDDVAGIKDIVAIEFLVTIGYEPKAGQIELSGEVMWQGDNARKVLKTWKDKKALDEEIALDIYNHIFRKCIIKAFSLAEDVRLPPPMTVPVMVKGEPPKTATAG